MSPIRLIFTAAMLAASLGAQTWERPVALILNASGESFVATPGIETQFSAAPGVMLFSGQKIRSASGTVQFAFCPTNTGWILQPGREVTLLEKEPRASAGSLQSTAAPSYCELPFMLRSPEPSGGAQGQSSIGISNSGSTPLSPGDQLARLRRLDELEGAIKQNPSDLAAKIARAASLQMLGLENAFVAAMQEVAKDVSAMPGMSKDNDPVTYHRGFKHEQETPSSTPAASGETYALLVGISQYMYKPIVPSLQFADKDAELFAEFLASDRGGSLMPRQIHMLRNAEATRAGVDQAIRDIARDSAASQRRNTLILFVAAHGGDIATEVDPRNPKKVLREEPYILTFETNPQDPHTTGYPMAEFARMVAREAGLFHRVLVFVDVCHADVIAGIKSGHPLETEVLNAFHAKTDEFGMMLATNGDAFESGSFSDSHNNGHGVFSFYVIDGWNGAASLDRGRSVQFVDLQGYVQTKVPWATNRQQVPQTVAPTPNLVLVDNLGAKKQSVFLKPPDMPLPDTVTRKRQAPPRDVGTIAVQAASQETVPSAGSLEEAIRNGNLLPPAAGNAVSYLETLRNDASVPRSTIESLESRLRAALEDKGEETILRYLEGDQIPQTKADFDRGGDYFEQAWKLAPDASFDESRMLFCRGRALIFDHAYDMAQPLLERSIRLDARRSYAYNALGIAYLEEIATSQGATFDQAIRAFDDAIRFAPNWAYPRHNLALAYAERGDYRNAQRAYAEAAHIAPHYSYLPYNLGLLHQKLNEYAQADRDYQAALDIAVKNKALRGPVNGGPWKERSVIYNAMGSLEAARGRWSKAEENYRKASADDPASVNARHNLALLLSRNGKSMEAEELWYGILKDNPDNLPALLSFADYWSREGDPGRSVMMYRCVLNLRPDYPGARRKLAVVLASQNRLVEAMEELKKARTDAPNAPELVELIGDLEARQGDSVGARREWNTASDLTPDRAEKNRLKQKIARQLTPQSK